jgi:hypothetical protein
MIDSTRRLVADRKRNLIDMVEAESFMCSSSQIAAFSGFRGVS